MAAEERLTVAEVIALQDHHAQLTEAGLAGEAAQLHVEVELNLAIATIQLQPMAAHTAVVLHPKLAILKLARLMAVGALLVLVRFHVGVVINIDLVQIPILPMVEQVVLV